MASGIFDSALRLGPLAISPHFFLESLAYAAGFARSRRPAFTSRIPMGSA
jgi:hypothetical protein